MWSSGKLDNAFVVIFERLTTIEGSLKQHHDLRIEAVRVLREDVAKLLREVEENAKAIERLSTVEKRFSDALGTNTGELQRNTEAIEKLLEK
jgi:hypothetical protein